LLSMVQMPAGIPVGTLAIGRAGAANAALFAAAILGVKHPEIREAIRRYREVQAKAILEHPDPREH
ncbi:MAG TPA: AIR carboxylase family protein, partial [Blastocatellia bacterium]|nr:AIR carboxylase family protein [Blastocatellia bacterium]